MSEDFCRIQNVGGLDGREPGVQNRSILEIAGQQITRRRVDEIDDYPTTVTQSVQRGDSLIMECNLDLNTILQVVENMCSKLTESGEEYIMMTANPYKQTSNLIGSTQGREFIRQNTEVMQNFVKQCYYAACSLNSQPDRIDKEVKHTVKNKDNSGVGDLRNSQATDTEFSDNNETIDSDVTENYEVENFVQKSIEIVEKNLSDEKSNCVNEVDGSPGNATEKFKEYPHPKKRLTKMKLHNKSQVEDDKHQLKSKNKRAMGSAKQLIHPKFTFACEICEKTFKSRPSLTKHKKKNHGKNKFACKTSFKRCESKDSADLHCKLTKPTIQTEERPKIERRNQTANKSLKKNKHAKQIRETASYKRNFHYKCEHCSKAFFREKTYKSHMIFHEEPKYSCTECEKSFYLKNSLAKHNSKFHKKPKECSKKQFECKTCLVVFVDKENYELHNCEVEEPSNYNKTYESRVTEDGKHACGICDKVFNKRRGLLTHRKLHSDIYTSSNICEICSKSYRTRNSLRKHMKIVHTDTRDFVCDLCGKSFKQQDTLNAHMRVHDTNRTGYECTVCGKYLSAAAALNVHMRTHQNLKPFMCDICGWSFSQRGNLVKHMLSHSNKTCFACTECGKSFKYQETWKTHMRSHALKAGLQDHEVKAYGKFYTCEFCSKKFPSASQYKVHLRKHTNERPYPCETCGKSFKERGKLSRHMKIHTTRPGEHNEHNYISCDKAAKEKKKDPLDFVNIAMKPDFNTDQITIYRNESGILVENSTPGNESSHPNVQIMEQISYTEDPSGTNMVILKEVPSTSSTEHQMRVLDDSRHQFLVHQLTPLTNLIMESGDGRQFHVPSTSCVGNMQLMHVGLGEDSHVISETHVSHSGYPAVTNAENQAVNLHSYSKYF